MIVGRWVKNVDGRMAISTDCDARRGELVWVWDEGVGWRPYHLRELIRWDGRRGYWHWCDTYASPEPRDMIY